jgi:hypothetical protein
MSIRISISKFAIAFVPIWLFGGCANVSYLSNQTSLSVMAETASNPSQPVSLLFGFDRRSLVAVPPRDPAALPNGVHEGNVLSSVGVLKVEPTKYDNKNGDLEEPKPWDITVSSLSITGKAADLATEQPTPNSPDNTSASDKVSKYIGDLLKTADSPLPH